MITINQYKVVRKCFAFLLLTSLIYISACKKNDQVEGGKGAPVITSLRAISPKPNDSTLTTAGPGQFVVIRGKNLASTREIYFNGWPATFNPALFSDTTAVVLIPADMPFATLDKNNLDKVRLITTHGETTFSIPIVPPAPIIVSMTNENALAGTVVTMYGNNLFFVDKVVFPGGISVTENLKANDAGTMLTLTVPMGITTGGHVKVINRYGEGASVFLYNDFVTGMFANFDIINPFQGWSSILTNDAALYPGARGNYIRMKFENIGAKDLSWWTDGRSIPMNPGQWLPKGNLSDPTDDWAIKFDIYVKEPWTTGALVVRTTEYDYMARYDPWKTEESKSFTTTGWITVTMPMSKFKKEADGLYGTGEAIPSLAKLLGETGNKEMVFMFYNDSETPIAKFDAAIDNIRIVKNK